MLYLIQWDNEEKTVILQQYSPGATKDDWYQLARESAQMLGTVSHTVHLIIDERNVDLTATSTDMQYLEKHVPTNEGACIMVIPAHLILYRTTQKRIREKLFHTQYDSHFVETVEEARKLLLEQYGVVYSVTSDGK